MRCSGEQLGRYRLLPAPLRGGAFPQRRERSSNRPPWAQPTTSYRSRGLMWFASSSCALQSAACAPSRPPTHPPHPPALFPLPPPCSSLQATCDGAPAAGPCLLADLNAHFSAPAAQLGSTLGFKSILDRPWVPPPPSKPVPPRPPPPRPSPRPPPRRQPPPPRRPSPPPNEQRPVQPPPQRRPPPPALKRRPPR